jgi:hypothetical protein
VISVEIVGRVGVHSAPLAWNRRHIRSRVCLTIQMVECMRVALAMALCAALHTAASQDSNPPHSAGQDVEWNVAGGRGYWHATAASINTFCCLTVGWLCH